MEKQEKNRFTKGMIFVGLGLGVLLMAVGALSFKEGEREKGKEVATSSKGKVIVIDSGHGGSDPGKVGIDNILEKDVNLAIAKKLKEKLEKENMKVLMTREDDVGLYQGQDKNKKVADLQARVKLMNEMEPDLVVSIHQNSYSSEEIKGAQVFYFTHSSEAEKAAKILQEALKEVDSDNTRQAKSNDTYYLLKKTKPTTVIVECGFLSNRQEAQRLCTESYQDQLAVAIKKGILEYLLSNKT